MKGKGPLPALAACALLLGLSLAWQGPTGTKAPEAGNCTACHAMRGHAEAWKASTHAKAASCTDCHLPHENRIKAGVFGAADGLRHAAVALLAPDRPPRLGEAGTRVLQANCLRCHGADAAPPAKPAPACAVHLEPGRTCTDCHASPHRR